MTPITDYKHLSRHEQQPETGVPTFLLIVQAFTLATIFAFCLL